VDDRRARASRGARAPARIQIHARTSDGERHAAGEQNLVVSFSGDENLVLQTDPQVLGYVQQKSLDTLLRNATTAPDPKPLLQTLWLSRGG
jgi:hypothetical protein